MSGEWLKDWLPILISGLTLGLSIGALSVAGFRYRRKLDLIVRFLVYLSDPEESKLDIICINPTLRRVHILKIKFVLKNGKEVPVRFFREDQEVPPHSAHTIDLHPEFDLMKVQLEHSSELERIVLFDQTEKRY